MASSGCSLLVQRIRNTLHSFVFEQKSEIEAGYVCKSRLYVFLTAMIENFHPHARLILSFVNFQHGSVGSNLVDDLPAPMIKKLFHFYASSERRIKLIEDENAGIMVCNFHANRLLFC